jgi:mannuronan synthase
MPFFIWWCLIDQRLAMWTMLFSPMLAFAGALKLGAVFLVAYFMFIAITRLILAMVLFTYAKQVDFNYVWILYVNQLLNAGVKIYMLWRLSKQKWANRGNQKQGFAGNGMVAVARGAMAVYLTALSFCALFLSVVLYSKLLTVPSWGMFMTMVFR